MASSWSPMVARGSPTPPRQILGFVDLGASSLSGLPHPVGLAVGDDGVAVVQESVEQTDGGGVFG